MKAPFWAKVFYAEFIRHYRKLDDAAIAADVRASMDDLEDLRADGESFGAKMVGWSVAHLAECAINGSKGGRPRKRPQDFETAVRVSGSGGSARGGRPDVPGATEFISSAPDPAPARSRKNLPELGEFRNVRISDGEMAALVSEFGNVSAVVEELSSYKAATGKCYKNDYAALRNWLRRRNAEGKRPDGTKRTQADRMADYFARRAVEIEMRERAGLPAEGETDEYR